MTAWPRVPLGEVLREVRRAERVRADREYPNFGIYSFGRGLFRKQPISGQTSSATTLFVARAGQVVYSRLFAFEGAYGLVGAEFDGSFVSNEYPLFDVVADRADPAFIVAYLSRRGVWEELAGRATGMGDRRRRVQPDQLLRFEIPLPSLSEQRRVVAGIKKVAGFVGAASAVRAEALADQRAMVLAAYRRITADAPRTPMRDVAPLVRRPIEIDPERTYRQVAVRSFGRGTFQHPPFKGSEVTWQRHFLVREGDILISNIKAWEGAVAVASAENDGSVGSHRYLTCVPAAGVATARFICFHLLTAEGLHALGEGSPGSADRNRTLGSSALMSVPIPVPALEEQLWFGAIADEVGRLERLQDEMQTALKALLPAVLDRAFRGEL